MKQVTRAQLAVVTAAVCIGTTGTAQALGPDASTPLGVGAVRALVGAAALWLFVPERSFATVRRNPMLIAAGSLGVAIYQPAFFLGVERGGVALGTIVAIGSGPAFAGIMGWARGRKPARRWFVGTALAVAGGALIVVANPSEGAAAIRFDLGALLAALAAGFGYALYATTAPMVAEREAVSGVTVTATEVLAWQFSLGSLTLVPILLIEPIGWLFSISGILLALHLGVVTIAVAYWLVGYGLARIDPPTVTTLMQAEPVTASLFAVLVLEETLSPVGWSGAVAVVAGLLIAGRAMARGGNLTPA